MAFRKALSLRQRLPSVGATVTTAASGGNRESLLGQRPARRKQCAADAGSRNSALSSEARLRGLLKYKKIRQQTSFLLGRMLPYPWCHLNYRHSVPVTLCALPVESTAAITSGARLPLLRARGGFRGKLTGVRSGPAICAAHTCPHSLEEGAQGLTFPVHRFLCRNCITAFCPCQHLRSNFYRFVQPARLRPHLQRSCGTNRTKRCPRTAA